MKLYKDEPKILLLDSLAALCFVSFFLIVVLILSGCSSTSRSFDYSIDGGVKGNEKVEPAPEKVSGG